MFIFDQQKSELNLQKHGIDFYDAQKLWEVPSFVLISKYIEEPRCLLIGIVFQKYWAAVFTERNSSIRIISVRRARKNERDLYEKEVKNK